MKINDLGNEPEIGHRNKAKEKHHPVNDPEIGHGNK
jgi:hypothetical protein